MWAFVCHLEVIQFWQGAVRFHGTGDPPASGDNQWPWRVPLSRCGIVRLPQVRVATKLGMQIRRMEFPGRSTQHRFLCPANQDPGTAKETTLLLSCGMALPI